MNKKIDRIWADQLYPINLIETGDSKYSYREAGSQDKDAPVMAVLHGIGSGSGSWVHTLSHFKDSYRILAWDAPGYNFSSFLPEENPGALGYARALNKFLSALDVDPKIVIGHSLGAMIAGAYAAEVNLNLPILILADPANGYGQETLKVRYENLSARLSLLNEFGVDGMAEKRSANLLSSSAAVEALELVKWNMRKITIRGYEQASKTLSEGNLSEKASEYRGRVLVLCGGDDQVTPVAACRKVAQAYLNAPFEILPNLGHASYVEGPELFNQAVETFLELVEV